MSDESEEFVGGAGQEEVFGGHGAEEGLQQQDFMQSFQSPPVPRKRKNNNRQVPQQQVKDLGAGANAVAYPGNAGQQVEKAAALGHAAVREGSDSSQRSGPFNQSTAKKESLKNKMSHERSGGRSPGAEQAQDDDVNAHSQFATQYEQAILRVQKSREMQNVSGSLANTSQSASHSQLARNRSKKFVPSKQRTHSQMGSEQSGNADAKNMGSFGPGARGLGEEGSVHQSYQGSHALQSSQNYDPRVNQSEVPIDANQMSAQNFDNINLSLLQNYRQHAGGSRTVHQPSTPVAGAPSLKYLTQDRANMSNLLRQVNDDKVSISIKDQLQLQLQYAEAQEEEFRQQMQEKRKRGMTFQKSSRAPEGQPEFTITTFPEDKGGGGDKGNGADGQVARDQEDEGEFLQILRQQMVHLQERLKIEIRHKLTLIRHVSALQREVHAMKQREKSFRTQQDKSQEEAEEAAPEGPVAVPQLCTVATQTEPLIDIGKYERDLHEASRAVRSGQSLLQENEIKETGPKDSASQNLGSYSVQRQSNNQQQSLMDLADQTQDKGQYPQNSLMFLEHQNSANHLPYHSLHNNGYDAGNNKNDVSEFKAAQNTYIVLPDSVLLQDVEGAPRGEDQSALQSRAHPPSNSTFLSKMHDEEGFVEVMPPGDSSGVGSSIQRDDEVSEVLKAAEMNQTIASSASPLKLKPNETMEAHRSPDVNATLAQDADSEANRTDGDILFNQNRKEAMSFGFRASPNQEAREEAPAPTIVVDEKADPEQSSQVRPSAREKDMNVILESLNETQSQIDTRSPQVANEQMRNQQDERMLDMQHVNQSEGPFVGGYPRPRHNSIAPPAFGGPTRPPAMTLDEEERRKIQMQWRQKIVKSHRKTNLDVQRKSEQHDNSQKLHDNSINLGKSSTARDQKSQVEGSLLQDSQVRERTHSYKLIKYAHNQLTLSAHTLFDNPNQKKRTSIQMHDSDQSRLQISRGANGSEKADKDYKAMFQLLLEEKKRQVKNTKELIDKIHGLTDEIKVLKQKNKQLSTVINRFGNLDNHFEFPMPAAPQQNISQVNYQQTLTKFVQDQYDEVLQEQIYNQSVNFNLDQKHMQGLGTANLNHDQTVVANKLHQDDRDLLIQQMQRGRDSHNSLQEGRAKNLRIAGPFDRQGRSSISPYKYKDPRLSADKSGMAPRSSNSRFNNNRFSANEHDTSQSNFANVTQHPGGAQESIPQTHNIEIRMRNRLRQNQNSHYHREYEKSPNAIHHMSQHQRQSIKEKIAEARGNQQKQIMRIQQLAGDNLSFNVDVEESNIMSAGVSSRHPQKKHRAGAEVFEPPQIVQQHLLAFPAQHQAQTVDPAQGDYNSITKNSLSRFNSQARLESQLSARSAIYAKDYRGELGQSNYDLAEPELRSTKEQPQQVQVHFAEPQLHQAAHDGSQGMPRFSAESGTNNKMNITHVDDAERRSDPRQMMTKEQRRKLESAGKGKKGGKSGRDGGGSGFMSILKKKLMGSGGKEDKYDKKNHKKRQSLGQRSDVEALSQIKSQGEGPRRGESKEGSNRARSVGAREEEFEYIEDEYSDDEDQQQRLQQSERIQRRDGNLDFRSLTQGNNAPQAGATKLPRETYNQRDTLDVVDKQYQQQQQKEMRKKIKEDSKATRSQYKTQTAHRLSFNPGLHQSNQFQQSVHKQESEEQRSHFMVDDRGTFNPEGDISVQKQTSANFGGSNHPNEDSIFNDEKMQQAEKMNLHFGQLASGTEGHNSNQMGIFGQQIGQSFNISAIPRDRDASQFFINHTQISIQNSTFNNASFIQAPHGTQQQMANFGMQGNSSQQMSSQYNQMGHGSSHHSGAFQGMRNLNQNQYQNEYSDIDPAMPARGSQNKDQIKEQFLKMSRGKAGSNYSQQSSSKFGVGGGGGQHQRQTSGADRIMNYPIGGGSSSFVADPRNTSPIEAAMSMRMSVMSNNTNVPSSRQDQSAVSNSMKLQNKQRRKEKETKGLVFQDASKNK